MFGYINVNRKELSEENKKSYQSYYCGLCQSLHASCGKKGQMLLNYDMTFLVVLLTGLYELQNKEKAFRLLRSKLYELELEKQQSAEAEARRSQIGTGDRSEKIRTYNFPQGRVTDHRINLTLYKLDKIMNGDIQEIIDACIAADQAAKLLKMNS